MYHMNISFVRAFLWEPTKWTLTLILEFGILFQKKLTLFITFEYSLGQEISMGSNIF